MSTSVDQQILIEVLTTLDAQGIDAAIAKYKTLKEESKANTEAAKSQGTSMEGLKQRVSGATMAIRGFAQASEGGTGAVEGLATAARGLMSVMKADAAMLGWVAVISTVVSAVVGWIANMDEAKKATEEAGEAIDELKAKSPVELQVDGALKGLEAYRDAASAAAEQAERVAAANRALEDAGTKLALADLEARKAEELKDPKLSADQRKEVELKYAQEELKIRGDAATKRASAEADEAKRRIAANEAEAKGLEEQRAKVAAPIEGARGALEKEFSDLQKQGIDPFKKVSKEELEAQRSATLGYQADTNPEFLKGRQKKLEQMETAFAAQQRIAEQEAALAAAEQKANPELARLDADIAAKRGSAGALQTAATAAEVNAAAVAREQQAAAARWQGARAGQTQSVRDREAGPAGPAGPMSPADALRAAQGGVLDQAVGPGGVRYGSDVGRATGEMARGAIAEAGRAIAGGAPDGQVTEALIAKLREMGAVLMQGPEALAAQLDAMDGVIGDLKGEVAQLKSRANHGRTP